MNKIRITSLLALVGPLLFASVRATVLPTPVTTVVPVVSQDLANAPGSVELLIKLNPHGYVTAAEVKHSTNPKLDAACLAAIRQWRYSNPNVDTASFVQPFRFGGDTIDTSPVADTRPEPRLRVAPKLPEELSAVSGEVMVAIAINADGTVAHASIAKSTHEELNAYCVEAAQQWTFRAATEQGRPIASNVYVPFRFRGSERAVTAAVTAKAELVDNHQLIPVRQPSPAVPENIAVLDGEASVLLTVDERGYVVDALVQSTSHPDLGEFARSTVLNWKFRPIQKDGVAIAVKAVQPFKFGEGTVVVTPVDKLPSIRRSVAPALPEELVGAAGFARAVFEIDVQGHVVDVNVTDCSHEAFKAAILAVAKDWTFKPALKAGVPTQSRVTVPFVFGTRIASN